MGRDSCTRRSGTSPQALQGWWWVVRITYSKPGKRCMLLHHGMPERLCIWRNQLPKDKEKKKDKHKEKATKEDKKAPQLDITVPAGAAAYADGQPLDRVQYLEAKLILKPDRFTSVQAFRDFGKIVQRTAKKVGAGFVEDRETGLRPEVREIIFGDTPDFRLYNNAFILRRRLLCGWLSGRRSRNRVQVPPPR